MFDWKSEQKTFKIGNVEIGGRLGEIPTVMIGSIFYHGHKIVENEAQGVFDKDKALSLINRQDELSDITGNPSMVDVVCASPEALEKYLDFVSGATESPIMMDVPTAEMKITGLEYIKESGLIDRIVYNSLTPKHTELELKKIAEVRLKSAILLTMSFKDLTSKGRVTAAREILAAVGNLIEKPLIDTCVLDIPSLGFACRSILQLKDELGFPVGCGAHNAISTWRGLKTKMDKRAVEPCTASACVLAVAVGADFILYGPIETADYLFPAVAMTDASYGQIAIEQGYDLGKKHPRFKIA